MSLDEFVRLYEGKEKAEAHLTTHIQDPYNPAVYNNAVSKAIEIQGRDPRVDVRTGQLTEISPSDIRRLLDTWYNVENSRARNYAQQNLESLLGSLDKSKLQNLILAVKPHKNIGYNRVADLHEKYMGLVAISRVYQDSKSVEEKKAALSDIYKKVPEFIEKQIRERNAKRDEKDKLTGKDIEMWRDALAYIAYTNPGYALGIYLDEAEATLERMKKELGTKEKLKDYIAKNVRKSEEAEKDKFHEIFYRLVKR